jgi:hypothetical protein
VVSNNAASAAAARACSTVARAVTLSGLSSGERSNRGLRIL